MKRINFSTWLLALAMIYTLTSCCEECQLVFTPEEQALFPYEAGDTLVFFDDNGNTRVFVAGPKILESDDKVCNQNLVKVGCQGELTQELTEINVKKQTGEYRFFAYKSEKTGEVIYQLEFAGMMMQMEPQYTALYGFDFQVRDSLYSNVRRIALSNIHEDRFKKKEITALYYHSDVGLLGFETFQKEDDYKQWLIANPTDPRLATILNGAR